MSESDQIDQSRDRNPAVLYIEDNPANLLLMQRIMVKRPTVRLLTATTGRHGLAIALESCPTLILLDLNLPDLQGDEVLSTLRQHPCTRAIPVSILSADASSETIERLNSLGARDFLTKPFHINQLLEVVDRFLPSSQARV